MKHKSFLQCTSLVAMCYLAMSVLYYSQISRMGTFFSVRFLYMTADGFANLAQASGLFLFMLLMRRDPEVVGSNHLLAGLLAAAFPIICLSLLVPSGIFLFLTVLALNLLCGFCSASYLTFLACRLSPKAACMSFAAAYAAGSFLTWLITCMNTTFLTSPMILPLDLVLLSLCVFLVLRFGSLPKENEKTQVAPIGNVLRENRMLLVLVALMSAVSMLGSADNAELNGEMSLASVRALYGIGLLFTAFIYNKSKNAGTVAVMASLVWAFLAIALFHEGILPRMVGLISYITLGFFSVYRFACFADHTGSDGIGSAYAALGLAVSRVADAVVTLLLGLFYDQIFLASLIAAGILFVPLLILFFWSFTKEAPVEFPVPVLGEEERRAAFAARFGLTRREEQIAFYLAQSKSNGEIAAILQLSENTVRFHVSNVLKKTGLHDRNEVGRVYNQDKNSIENNNQA